MRLSDSFVAFTDDVRRQINLAVQNLADRFGDFVPRHGLGDKAYGAVGHRFEDHVLFFFRGQDHYRNIRVPGAQGNDPIQAIHARHVQIEKD